MTGVGQLYDPHPDSASDSATRPQDVLVRKGYLRVLAFFGESDLEDYEEAAKDGGPLAILKLDGMSDVFGQDFMASLKYKLR